MKKHLLTPLLFLSIPLSADDISPWPDFPANHENTDAVCDLENVLQVYPKADPASACQFDQRAAFESLLQLWVAKEGSYQKEITACIQNYTNSDGQTHWKMAKGCTEGLLLAKK